MRWRIAGWSASVAGLAVVALAVGTLINIYWEQLEVIDLQVELEGQELVEESLEEILEPDSMEPWLAVAVYSEEGQLIGMNPHFHETAAQAALQQEGFGIFRQGDVAWRVRSFAMEDEGMIVVVGFDLADFYDTLGDLAKAYAVLTPLILILVAGGSWHLAGRALEPVRQSTAAAGRIGTRNLHERLPESDCDDEIGRLTLVINDMLERLERGYRQAERFAADASHELRTPLTIVKGELERLLTSVEHPPETEERLVSVQNAVERLHRTVEHLLLLARFDAGRAGGERIPLNFSQLVADVSEDMELMAVGKSITVNIDCAPDLMVRGNTGQLRQVLVNLFDNAVKFNHPGGRIELCAQASTVTREVRLAVANTGSGIPAELHNRVFERFFSADPSRTDRGQGLGLSLCREIVRAHGGEITLGESLNEWTKFVVTLPKADTTDPA